jgi:hypothetical protein
MNARVVLLLGVIACAEPGEPEPGEPRGAATIVTWSDGAVTGDLKVYLQDASGDLRGAYQSDADGVLVVYVGIGWYATVVDDRGARMMIDTVGGLAPGASIDLGRRRAGGAALPVAMTVAPLAPVDGASAYGVAVCGPTITATAVPAGKDAVAYYDPGALDDDGGALLVARATVGEAIHFATLDVPDVAEQAKQGGVAFGAWQDAVASTTYLVAAPAGAIEREVAVRGAHDCALGAARAPGAVGELSVAHLPIDVHSVSATAWYRDEPEAQSYARRRAAPAEVIDLTAPPARVDDVVIRATSAVTVVDWEETGGPGGDGVAITVITGPSTVWNLLVPRDVTALMLPQLPEVLPGVPDFVSVSIVDLDDAGGWDDLVTRAGVPLFGEPGWLSTGTFVY